MDKDAIQEDLERWTEGLDAPLTEFPEIALSVSARSLAPGSAVTVGPDATIQSAIETMLREGVGYVVVAREGKIVGILTERDILMKTAPECRALEARAVSEVMTSEPKMAPSDATLAEALRIMHTGHLRHLPLVGPDRSVTAVISVRDVVDYLVRHFPAEVLTLPAEPVRDATPREGA
jgi:CBS domain-containing protein